MTLIAMDRRSVAFATLYEQHYGAVHAYASRRVGADAADEIAAETFLIAWRRWETVPEESLPWLYGVARNVVRRHHEAMRRQTLAREAAERERPPLPVHPDVTGDPALWEAWERLRPADREALALIAWEELSVAGAARVVGCPAARFSVRLFRARRRLERLLAGAHASSDRTEA
jgi:RNA polymerase sigma-70 factor (ECF subfamily)